MAERAAFDVDRFLSGKPLALTPSGLEELRAHILGRIRVFDGAPRDFLAEAVSEVRAAVFEQQQQRQTATAVGVIPIRGTISHHARGDLSSLLFGGTSTEQIAADLRAMLADESVRSIVLDIDSPGGTVAGVPELAAEIHKARAQKPIVSLANGMSASAAYYLGAMASASYAIPSALVGSVGVYMLHEDLSGALDEAGVKMTFISAGKYKVEGNPTEPLGDEARGHLQAIVDDAYDQFVRDVATGRGVPEMTVRNGYGQGRVVTAKQAKAYGMIDGIYTLEQTIARASQMQVGRASLDDQAAAEAVPVDVQTSDDEGRQRLALMRWRALEERTAV